MPTPPLPNDRRASRRVYLTAVALPLFALFGSFLGGATERWSEAIAVGGLAFLLIVRPPRTSLGWPLNLLALIFFALAAAAFLPAHWFYLPSWRIALINDFGLQLPPTLSPQPWLSLDASLLLLAGFGWLYCVATFDAGLREVRLAARIFSAGVIALAALCILFYLRQTAFPFWHNVRGFGPYPNRNQTGDLFGISTLIVLACLEEDFRRHRQRWIFWLAGVVVLVTALVLDFSRAGILILLVGTAAWLLRLSLRKWSGASVAVGSSLLLVLLASLLLFGGETIARFHLSGGETVRSDFRWLIFRDAWTMIRDSPWCGLGLGNFESVFALYRDASRDVERALHPESDWLWLGGEMGWPAILVVAAAFWLFVRRALPLREGTNQRLRYAALIGAALFAMHGLADVSAHRFGTFLTGTFLFGLAQFRPAKNPPTISPAFFFRLVGIFLLVVAAVWFVSSRGDFFLPGDIGVAKAKEAAAVADREQHYAEGVQLCDRALVWAPLDWQLYFQRALSRIGARQSAADALADFRRARFLEPSAWQLPFEEGQAWVALQPVYALTAWQEALRRRPDNPTALYSQMFSLAAGDRKVLDGLRDLARQDPRLTITYLESLGGDDFRGAREDLLRRDPELKQLDDADKNRFFDLWSRREQLDDLARTIAAHPDWEKFAWRGLARWGAQRSEFQPAWKLVQRYSVRPPLPSASADANVGQLREQAYSSANDYAAGYALYRAQVEAGQIDDALATVRYFTAHPDAPAYFKYLEAEAWASKQNWRRAWESWEQFEEKSQNSGG